MDRCKLDISSEAIMNELRTEINKKHLEFQVDQIFTSNPDVAKIMREIRAKYQQPSSSDRFDALYAQLMNSGISLPAIGSEMQRINEFVRNTESLVKQSAEVGAILPYPNKKNEHVNRIIYFFRRVVRKLTRFSLNAQTENNQHVYACIKALRESEEQTIRLCAIIQNLSIEQEKLSCKVAVQDDILKQRQGNAILDERYLHFENQFRGSTESIYQRLGFYYTAYVEKLVNDGKRQKFIDLGCGRGEWLSLLKEKGIEAIGVDLNQRMVESCLENKLQACQMDGVAYLKTLETASVSLITGFQIIEHICLAEMTVLLEEAYRVLEDGGMLILETPNYHNVDVATKGFYSDPTHMRPVSQDYLKFLAEQVGFGETEIAFWKQEEITNWLESVTSSDNTQALASPVIRTMLESMKSMVYNSPDYALIAKK